MKALSVVALAVLLVFECSPFWPDYSFDTAIALVSLHIQGSPRVTCGLG